MCDDNVFRVTSVILSRITNTTCFTGTTEDKRDAPKLTLMEKNHIILILLDTYASGMMNDWGM